jgi:hypothetical protein
LPWVQDNHTAVIHIRRGDFLTNHAFGACDKDYYQAAIKKLISKSDIKQILVFSNDDGKFLKSLNFSIPFQCYPSQANTRSIIEEFFLLKQSKNLIISNSTYSWWAAFLNLNSIYVLAPNNWARNKKIDTNMRLLIQKDWIIIKNELDII